MKSIICLAAMIFFLTPLHAQSISASVIGFTGGNMSNGSAMLSTTGGEPTGGVLNNGTTQIGQGFQQGYYSYWVGITNSDWNTATNWRGGPVPDANTDAIINSASPFYPVIVANVFCRSLLVNTGASVTVTPSFKLTVTH